jgi:predicted MFS family arabinose efflux permease
MKNSTLPLTETHSAWQAPVAKALAGFAALAVAMGIGRFAFTPVLPMMLQDGGLSLQAGGWLASANYLGYLIGALSAMVLKVRPERAIHFGLACIGVTTLAMGAGDTFAVWVALRLLAGLASAWVLISVSAWCLDTLAVYRRPFLNSLVFAGVGGGIATAGLLCLALTYAQAGSKLAWTALGLLALTVTTVIWRFFMRHDTPAGAAAAAPPAAAPAAFHWNGDALRLVFCYGIFGFGYIIPATFLPVMAKNALHGSPAFGWSWPLFGLAAALSTLTVAALVRRWSNRQVWIACHLVMAAGIVLPVWSPQLLSILAAALCVGGTFMVLTLVALQEAKKIAGNNARTLIAAMTSAFAAGQIVGPLTVGGASGGFTTGLIVAAALLAASALLLRKPSET